MDVENLSDELLVHHLEGVISKLSTDAQAESLMQKVRPRSVHCIRATVC